MKSLQKLNTFLTLFILLVAVLSCNENKMTDSSRAVAPKSKDENLNSSQYSSEIPIEDNVTSSSSSPTNTNNKTAKKPSKAVLPANIAGAFLAGYAGHSGNNPVVGINMKCQNQNNAFVWDKELCSAIEGSIQQLLVEAQHIIQQCNTLTHHGKDYELNSLYPKQYSEKWVFEFEVMGGPIDAAGSIINCNFDTISGNQNIRIPVTHPNTVPELSFNLTKVPDDNYFFYNGRALEGESTVEVSFIFDYIITSDIIYHDAMKLSFDNFQAGDNILLIGGIAPTGRMTNLKDIIQNRPYLRKSSLSSSNQVIFTREEIQQAFPENPILTMYIISRSNNLRFNQMSFGDQNIFTDNPIPLSTNDIQRELANKNLRRISASGRHSTKNKDGSPRTPIDFALVANKFDSSRVTEGCGHDRPVTLHFETEYRAALSIHDHMKVKIDSLPGQELVMQQIDRSCEEFEVMIDAYDFLPYLEFLDMENPLAGNYYFMKDRPQSPEFPSLIEYLLYLKNGQESHFLRADLRGMIFLP